MEGGRFYNFGAHQTKIELRLLEGNRVHTLWVQMCKEIFYPKRTNAAQSCLSHNPLGDHVIPHPKDRNGNKFNV